VVRTHESSPPKRAAENRLRCDEGEMAGCHAAALDAYYAPPSPESDAAAARYFHKGCEGGYAPACNGLGLLHKEGRGVPQDDAAAVRLYRQACAAGASTGCRHLADVLRSGKGTAVDHAAADRAAMRAVCLNDGPSDIDPDSCPAP
jgi:hypothetical protein